MSATLFDDDGDLVAVDVEPTPAPDPCPGCGFRRGRHVADCTVGGDQ